MRGMLDGGSKIVKNRRTSFMDVPLSNLLILNNRAADLLGYRA